MSSISWREALDDIFATNFPEFAITVSAVLAGNLDLAVGNIVGGIALQTLVLVAMDVAFKRGSPSGSNVR